MNQARPAHLRATYAALYALARTVPAEGIPEHRLRDGLGARLDKETFLGLLNELNRRKVVRLDTLSLVITRGDEYADGMERLRLAGESLKGS